jgi:hypothetical protein
MCTMAGNGIAGTPAPMQPRAHQLLSYSYAVPAVSVGGASIPLPFDPELWALGQATHASWSAAKLPPTCAFYNLHGTGLSTPYDAQYGVWWYPVQASATTSSADRPLLACPAGIVRLRQVDNSRCTRLALSLRSLPSRPSDNASRTLPQSPPLRMLPAAGPGCGAARQCLLHLCRWRCHCAF